MLSLFGDSLEDHCKASGNTYDLKIEEFLEFLDKNKIEYTHEHNWEHLVTIRGIMYCPGRSLPPLDDVTVFDQTHMLFSEVRNICQINLLGSYMDVFTADAGNPDFTAIGCKLSHNNIYRLTYVYNNPNNAGTIAFIKHCRETYSGIALTGIYHFLNKDIRLHFDDVKQKYTIKYVNHYCHVVSFANKESLHAFIEEHHSEFIKPK